MVFNHSKFVERNENNRLALTNYALAHMDECCIKFKLFLDDKKYFEREISCFLNRIKEITYKFEVVACMDNLTDKNIIELRKKEKEEELNIFKKMTSSPQDFMPMLLKWREANPNIVNFWWSVDKAVKDAVIGRCKTETHGIKFIYKRGILFIELPSNRRLAYIKPRIEINQYGSESIVYEGLGVSKKWERIESYGPKFVENIVQAIARDLLMNAILNLSNLDIVAHVHDELIIEGENNQSLNQVCRDMSRLPDWNKTLLLNADGYICEFYKKD